MRTDNPLSKNIQDIADESDIPRRKALRIWIELDHTDATNVHHPIHIEP